MSDGWNSYGFQRLSASDDVDKLAARLFVETDGSFLLKMSTNPEVRLRALRLELEDKRVIKSLQKKLLIKSLFLCAVAVVNALLAFFLRQNEFAFFAAAAFFAALYGFFYRAEGLYARCLRRLRRNGNHNGDEQGESNRAEVFALLDERGLTLIDKASHSHSRSRWTRLQRLVCEQEACYLRFRGESRYYPLIFSGIIKGDEKELCEFISERLPDKSVSPVGSPFPGSGSVGVSPLDPKTEEWVDLGHPNLRMRQRRDGFHSGEDAVCLAHFVAEHCVKTDERPALLEIGAGTGMSTLILSALLPECRGDMVELVPRQAELALNSIHDSGLQKRLRVCNADIRCLTLGVGKKDFVRPTSTWMAEESKNSERLSDSGAEIDPELARRMAETADRMLFSSLETRKDPAALAKDPASLSAACLSARQGYYDCVLANPPYRQDQPPGGLALAGTALERQFARFDGTLQPSDLAVAADFFLRAEGVFYLIYPQERVGELNQAFSAQSFYMQRKRSIRGRRDLSSKLALYAFARRQVPSDASTEQAIQPSILAESNIDAGNGADTGVETSSESGGQYLTIEEPALILRESDGSYSEEVKGYYCASECGAKQA